MNNISPNTGHGRETMVPAGVLIYSRTDLKGNIVEANEAFAEISGYKPEEMIGRPHSIVRHPDMPKEAFGDLWQNLKAGRPWRGLVKNRRKDGGYYWVVANASPVRENGQIVGYQSVRGCPSRAEVAEAEAAYARIRNGDTSISIEFGRVFRRLPVWRTWLLSLRTQRRMAGLACILPFLTLILGNVTGMDVEIAIHVVTSLCFVFGLFFMVYASATAKEVYALGDWLESILFSGDLRPRLGSSRSDILGQITRRADKIGSSLQATLQGLIGVGQQVRESTQLVTNKVDDISVAIRHQSDAAMRSASSIEELLTSVGQVAEHAQSTILVAKEAGRISGDGAKVTHEASDAIRALSDNVKLMAAQVERLGQRSEEIDRVTGVIKEIADQTNLLALNAAIEAARAGEQGRGFAVVADEVRKLAERTSQSTQEIATLVATIQQETRATVESMRAGAEQVEQGVRLSAAAEDTLRGIQAEMAKTQERVEEIAHATREQSSTLNDVAQAIQQVSTLCQDNTLTAEETQTTVSDLNAVVERMYRAVGQYAV